MITKLIMDALFLVPLGLLLLIPAWTLPTSLSPQGSVISTLHNSSSVLGSLERWLGLSDLAQVVLVVLSIVGIALTVRLLRVGASFLTGGGGSAA